MQIICAFRCFGPAMEIYKRDDLIIIKQLLLLTLQSNAFFVLAAINIRNIRFGFENNNNNKLNERVYSIYCLDQFCCK